LVLRVDCLRRASGQVVRPDFDQGFGTPLDEPVHLERAERIVATEAVESQEVAFLEVRMPASTNDGTF
jgi:hypothetical protein